MGNKWSCHTQRDPAQAQRKFSRYCKSVCTRNDSNEFIKYAHGDHALSRFKILKFNVAHRTLRDVFLCVTKPIHMFYIESCAFQFLQFCRIFCVARAAFEILESIGVVLVYWVPLLLLLAIIIGSWSFIKYSHQVYCVFSVVLSARCFQVRKDSHPRIEIVALIVRMVIC